jgi:hypothetical protein
MASRVTQASKAVTAAGQPSVARASQVSRTITSGGVPTTARASQVSRVIIATIQLAGNGNRMLMGVGM